MIDPFGLIALLRDVAKDWQKERIIQISPLDDIENEPIYQKLKAAGHRLRWCRSDQVARRRHEGWERVVKRDRLRRPYVFMDGQNELVLMYKRQDKQYR